MITSIKKACAMVASFGPLGCLPLGIVLCSLLAFPLLGLVGVLGYISPALGMWFFVLMAMVLLGATLYVMGDPDIVLVADKVVGLALAHVTLPLTFKLMLISFLGFHAVRLIVPFLIKRFVGYNMHEHLGMLSVVVASVLSGVIINIALRLVVWIAH